MTPLTVVANDATGTWDLHRHGTLVCRLESESLAYLLAAAPTLYDACLAAFQDQGVLAPAIRNQAVMESLEAALDIADGPTGIPDRPQHHAPGRTRTDPRRSASPSRTCSRAPSFCVGIGASGGAPPLSNSRHSWNSPSSEIPRQRHASRPAKILLANPHQHADTRMGHRAPDRPEDASLRADGILLLPAPQPQSAQLQKIPLVRPKPGRTLPVCRLVTS